MSLRELVNSEKQGVSPRLPEAVREDLDAQTTKPRRKVGQGQEGGRGIGRPWVKLDSFIVSDGLHLVASSY